MKLSGPLEHIKSNENHLRNLWHKRLSDVVLLILKLLVNFRRPKYELLDLCRPKEKGKQNRASGVKVNPFA